MNSLKNQHGIDNGVEVLHRSDYNYSEVADGIKDTIALFSGKTDNEVKEIRKQAAAVAEQAYGSISSNIITRLMTSPCVMP